MVVFVVVVFDTGKPAPVAAAHGATDSAHAGGTGLHAHWDTVERSDPGHNGGRHVFLVDGPPRNVATDGNSLRLVYTHGPQPNALPRFLSALSAP